jgi:hypothetical protein
MRISFCRYQIALHLCVRNNGFTSLTTMTEQFKKIDKEYVLSDSTVNEYGFRLLTDGYQLPEFQKNPIGYYMHQRDKGVALKWDDLKVDGDVLWGKPVINLLNERGAQTCAEVENGFLNAASVGHIVVLDYSTDADQMLPGQTGPTITRWYNKECSLVDIPGNGNALTRLYDAQENEMNLADMTQPRPILNNLHLHLTRELNKALNLNADADGAAMLNALKTMAENVATAKEIALENVLLRSDKDAVQTQLDTLNAAHTKYEIAALLKRALEDGRVTVLLKEKLVADYAGKPQELKSLLSAMPAYRSIADHLKQTARDNAAQEWSWDDFETKDPAGNKLRELKADNPERYQQIFKEKFAS